jgi:two-component system chemotaxis sensor kinase CheA
MLDSEETRTRLIKRFKVETAKHLDGLKSNLPKLESAPEAEDALEQIFFLAHTIKGNVGMMLLLDQGFSRLNPYAQNLEAFALALRDGQRIVEPGLLNDFYENISQLEYKFAEVA